MQISLSTLDPMIAQKSLLQHPFYKRWSAGQLTLEDLRVYAKEYYHLVKRIPDVVAAVLEHAKNEEFRAHIRENLIEEQEHIELWERFALSLGVSKQELMEHEASAMTKNAVAALEALAKQGLEEGMAAIYALERELPAIAQAKKEGLIQFYGLNSTDAHAYFDEHMNEEKHLQVWRAKPVDQACATAAAATSLTSQHQVLDAVCELRGLPMQC